MGIELHAIFFYRIEYHNAYSGRQQQQQLPTIDSRLPNHTFLKVSFVFIYNFAVVVVVVDACILHCQVQTHFR